MVSDVWTFRCWDTSHITQADWSVRVLMWDRANTSSTPPILLLLIRSKDTVQWPDCWYGDKNLSYVTLASLEWTLALRPFTRLSSRLSFFSCPSSLGQAPLWGWRRCSRKPTSRYPSLDFRFLATLFWGSPSLSVLKLASFFISNPLKSLDGISQSRRPPPSWPYFFILTCSGRLGGTASTVRSQSLQASEI